MQRVQYNSVQSVSLTLACCQNANTLQNSKEQWVHANLVNQLIRCAWAYIMQSKTQQVVEGDQKGAFNKSCGKFYRFDKYLVLEIYNFKRSSDKLAKKS